MSYYAFSWTRYEHAAAPTTPAAIIETGFRGTCAHRLSTMEVAGDDSDYRVFGWMKDSDLR